MPTSPIELAVSEKYTAKLNRDISANFATMISSMIDRYNAKLSAKYQIPTGDLRKTWHATCRDCESVDKNIVPNKEVGGYVHSRAGLQVVSKTDRTIVNKNLSLEKVAKAKKYGLIIDDSDTDSEDELLL